MKGRWPLSWRRSRCARRRPHGVPAEVARVCALIAEELALPADEIETVRTAGTLHDLDILAVDQGSPTHGQGAGLAPTRAMGEVTFLSAARPALELQHRPFNGGVPIPKPAAILALADAFVLARDGHGDLEALGERAAYEHVRRGSGTRFEPGIVDALGRLLRRARA